MEIRSQLEGTASLSKGKRKRLFPLQEEANVVPHHTVEWLGTPMVPRPSIFLRRIIMAVAKRRARRRARNCSKCKVTNNCITMSSRQNLGHVQARNHLV